MLPIFHDWHNAFQQDPEREARLLAFAKSNNAGGNTNNEQDSSDDDFEMDENMNVRKKSEKPKETIDERMAKMTDAEIERDKNRRQYRKMLEEEEREADQTNTEQTEENSDDATTDEQSENQEYLSSRKVLEEAEKTQKSMRDAISSIDDILHFLKDKPEKQYNTDAYNEWALQADALKSQLVLLGDSITLARGIHKWKEGETSPTRFVEWLPEQEVYSGNTEEAKQIIENSRGVENHDVENGIFPDATEAVSWSSYEQLHGQTIKNAFIHKISESTNIDNDLEEIHNLTQSLNSALEESKIEESIKSAKETIDDTQNKEAADANATDNSPKWHIEFYSAMDLFYGAKNWWDMYADAWKQRGELKRGKVQNRIARMMQYLPYGEQAMWGSQSKLDAEHRKRRNEYKEQITEQSKYFTDLFGPGKEFRAAAASGSPDYTMAILEYAADKGWLYTLKDTKLVDGQSLSPLLPSHWTQHQKDIYIENLISQNQQGMDKEISSRKESVLRKYENKEGFLQDFDKYLKEINFGSAIGVMQAMYERAIDSDEATHIATHFFRIIRENPEIRRNLTPVIVQQFANPSVGKPYFTMSNLFFDRNPLGKASQRPQEPINMEESGALAKTIAAAEAKMQRLSNGTLTAEQLDSYMPTFLSGGAVKLDKGNMSIWDPEFIDYRTETEGKHGNPNLKLMGADSVKDTAMDYYASDSLELLITSDAFVTELFNTGSTDKWEYGDRVTNYVGKIYYGYQKLVKEYKGVTFANPDDHPANVLRKELGAKLENALAEYISRSKSIHTTKLKNGNTNTNIGAVAALQALGFIDLTKRSKFGADGKTLYDKIKDEAGKIQNNLRAKGVLEPNNGSNNGMRRAA